MILGPGHRRTFADDGYLLLARVFTDAEIDALVGETSRLSSVEAPQRIMEADGVTVRSVYWVHGSSDLFGRLVRDHRMLEPARYLLGSDVYVYQTQLNPKAPLKGDAWEWHQDYLYWARDDGMPRPEALNVTLFLDDVTEFNGPILLIPGTHREALDDATRTLAEGWERTLTADLRHKVDTAAVARLMDERGLVSARGPRGSVLVFDSRLLHCSQPNITPHPRTILFVRYSSVGNVLRDIPNPRPTWLASREPLPVQPLTEPLLSAQTSKTGGRPMQHSVLDALTPGQVDAYRRDGFLVVEELFDADEVLAMRRALADERDLAGPQRVLEEDGRHVRAVYGCHQRQSIFAALVRSGRLLGPAWQLVDDELYVYQFKINTKRAFGGEAWSWHQDFVVWKTTDGLRESRAITCIVFLDDVTEFNGPLILVPGSHEQRAGTAGRTAEPRSSLHVDPADFAFGPDELAELVRTHGMTSPKGRAGSVVFFHPEIVHGSATNTSPFPRDLAFVTYNAVTNLPEPNGQPRPAHLVGRDTRPLQPQPGPLRAEPVEARRE